MLTPLKVAAYGGVLAVVFAGALGAGSVLGTPVPAAGHSHVEGEAPGGQPDAGSGHVGSHGSEVAQANLAKDLPGGLMVSDRGYTLAPETGVLAAGTQRTLNFRILGTTGAPVAAFEQSHDKQMHLIAVRSDTTGFQHVHPVLSDDGTWSVPLDLTPGTWRVFADFVPGEGPAAGESLTLGVDLSVAGDYTPAELPAVSRTAEVDGYSVSLAGDLAPGSESELTLAVSKDGAPVTDVEPYLGAYGHLVALRAGDLAYLHVHPAGAPGDGATQPGPGITFYAKVPSAGDYRLYLDFQHASAVRTAEFTVAAGRAQGTEHTGQPAVAGQDTSAAEPADGHSGH